MSKIKEMYEQFPFPNDKVKHKDEFKIHSWILNSIPQLPKVGNTIADVGCGTGEISCFLSQYGNVTGFDFCEKSLEIAKETRDRFNLNIDFVQDDITEKKERKKFDYVFCIGVLHHIPEEDKALENIKEMINDNGFLIVSVYNYWSAFFRKKIRLSPQVFIRDNNKSREIDMKYHVFEKFHTKRTFKKLIKRHGFEIVGEWRKISDAVRFLTGKGAMMTFCLKKKK